MVSAKTTPKKVLLITNSEKGQANVFLAVSHAILSIGQDDVEVHLASFPALEKDVRRTSEEAIAAVSSPSTAIRPIVFHPIKGLDMRSAWLRPAMGGTEPGTNQPPKSFSELSRKMRMLFRVLSPWTPDEFIEIFESIADILRDIGPDAVAVDPVFPQALTACRFLGIKFFILSPNTIKDFAISYQPWAEALWRYPCVGSPLPFPVPIYLIPFNIFLIFVLLILGATDPHIKNLRTAIWEHTKGKVRYTSMHDLHTNGKAIGVQRILVANLPEIEYPLRRISKIILPCGPMIRPAKAAVEVDPGLVAWIGRGLTVYINLGTHVLLAEFNAVEMAKSLRMLLDTAREMQGEQKKRFGALRVLWKLVKYVGAGDYQVVEPGCEIHKILGEYIDADLVRIVEWIEPEPISVLEQSNVVLAIHHGGANSFLEAVSAGVPQVVLGVWMDTYDFANRVELLEIGRWGNRITRPNCAASELGPALVQTLLGPRSEETRERAKEFARLCASNGGGRTVAARAILSSTKDTDAEPTGGVRESPENEAPLG